MLWIWTVISRVFKGYKRDLIADLKVELFPSPLRLIWFIPLREDLCSWLTACCLVIYLAVQLTNKWFSFGLGQIWRLTLGTQIGDKFHPDKWHDALNLSLLIFKLLLLVNGISRTLIFLYRFKSCIINSFILDCVIIFQLKLVRVVQSDSHTIFYEE